MKFSFFSPTRLAPVALNNWQNLMAAQQGSLRAYSSSKRLFAELFTPTLGLEKNVPNLQNPILATELKFNATRELIERSEKQLKDLKSNFAQLQKKGTGSYRSYDAIRNELLNKLSDAIRKGLASFEMKALYEECEVIDFFSPVLGQCGISYHIEPSRGTSLYKYTISVPQHIHFPLDKRSISPENPSHINLQIKFARDLEKTVTAAYEANSQEYHSGPQC